MEWLAWLERSPVATWVRESESIWAYPTILTLHTIGLGLLVGSQVVLSLRVLGAARQLPLAPLAVLFRVMWIGFAVNAVSGVALFIADATTFAVQPIFYVKLACIFLGVATAGLLQRAIGRDPASSSADRVGPRATNLAALALVLWAGAITAGRLMAYQLPAR
jgi:hypothetical protein